MDIYSTALLVRPSVRVTNTQCLQLVGTGKTSMTLALAGHFNLILYKLSLAEFSKGDAGLRDALDKLPEHGIVLLEDIDSAAFNARIFALRRRSINGSMKSP